MTLYGALHGTKDDMLRRNESLLDEIEKLCESTDREGPEVIVLIGGVGSGKSALINTIHKVLTGNYYQIAKVGSGSTQSNTLELKRYNNCGVSLQSISDEERRHKIEKVFNKLPTIIDCVGLGDVNDPNIAEILELIIAGFLPENTQIKALQTQQKKSGTGSLKRLYESAAPPPLKATKVVFMQSCAHPPQQNLIECLNQVLETTDQVTFTRKYTPEVFLLITKCDLVKDLDDPVLLLENTEQEITLTEFVELERRIACLLNIEGALEKNRIRLTDKVDKDNPCIANIALSFLKRMFEPGVWTNRQGVANPVMDVRRYLILTWFYVMNYLERKVEDLKLQLSAKGFVSCVVALLAVLIFFYLWKS